jgi:acetyltransferase-like isoleucine patch superfamily enzyme
MTHNWVIVELIERTRLHKTTDATMLYVVRAGIRFMDVSYPIRARRHRWLLSIGAAARIPAPRERSGLRYLACIGRGTVGAHKVRYQGLNRVGRHVEFSGSITLGFATTLSKGCWLGGSVTLGNYCQLGPRVSLVAADHDHRRLTTYNNRILFGGALKEFNRPAPITLGHSVWCGIGATVLRGVHIGNGAVVGAGAVVTRDIPPYQIAVGNPARVIKSRFDDITCELLEASRWWLRTPEELEAHGTLFSMNLAEERERALEELKQLVPYPGGDLPVPPFDDEF